MNIMEEDQPITRFKAGSVSCAIWQNRVSVAGRPTTILKATICRRYQDRNGLWQTSQSFSRNEIPLAILVLERAFESMLERTHEQEIGDAVEEAAGRREGSGSRPEDLKVRI